MISISKDIVNATILKYKIDIDIFTWTAQKNLYGLLERKVFLSISLENIYIQKIIDNLEKMVVAEQSEFESYIDSFDKIIPTAIVSNDSYKNFRKEVIEAMNYKGLRSSFYPKYFKEIGIKTCVYCNSQIAVAVDYKEYLKTKIKYYVIAKFQVDHSIPKNNCPFLSISLFNLYPACSSCNISKSTIEVKFKLYTSDKKNNQFSRYHFKLLNGSIIKYLKEKDPEKLIVRFVDPDKPDRKTVKKGSFQDTFDIEGIYETQKDLAEELIIKAQVYNKVYRSKLVTSFPKIFTHASLSNRVLVGNYTSPEDIHKRPMAKFTQDIARQLKLIK